LIITAFLLRSGFHIELRRDKLCVHYEQSGGGPQGANLLLWQPMPPTFTIDSYILETLMADLVGHDRQPSAFLVYLFLWIQTHGRKEMTTQVALRDIADGTGLSKRSVQDALGRLSKRKLISVTRESITAVPVYTVLRPWRR
jgi:hypothetical protein